MPFGKLSLKAGKDKKGAEEKGSATSSAAEGSSPAPSKEAPPAYTATEPEGVPPGPSLEELNAAFSNLALPDAAPALPTADHCLAHLKLLNSFHALKEDIGYSDGLFGLWDERCEVLEGKERDEALSKMREKRWALYVARAVERFEVWWLKVLVALEKSKRLEVREMTNASSEYAAFTETNRAWKWTANMLPPIDILMVWHAFMLNPRNYLEDCVRFGLQQLWATGMPWPAVNEAIDTSFNYTVPSDGMKVFSSTTRLSWDNRDDPMIKAVNCPRCSTQLDIPWTTCGMSEKPSHEEIMKMLGTGYGDQGLSYVCHKCGGTVNHDLLRVAKFRNDAENLILKNWPLGGTILDTRTGTPTTPSPNLAFLDHTAFPNRLIGLGLHSRIIELINPRSTNEPTMNDVRDMIESAIKDRVMIKKVNTAAVRSPTGLLVNSEKLSIRRMMSRYWENTSIFALELGGAVLRQSVFVDKMHDLDWLHSPAARSTMDRLLVKYTRFIEIIATYPRKVAVPTLDVDLAWHTHQLSPRSYFNYTMLKCKKFIDHDDKMDEDDLSTGFEWTSKTYQKHFKEVYSECTCWYCEAIRVQHSSSVRIFGASRQERVVDSFYESGAANLCPPDNSAHISSHSAVKPVSHGIKETIAAHARQKRQNDLEAAYKKACARAAAKGRPIPQRRGAEDYYMGPWGYPYLMYGPYMSMGMYGGVYYAGDPCVLPLGDGMAGNCAAGTCGGGVAGGACGAPGGCGGGIGGCAGGAGGAACGGIGGGACGGGGGGGCGGGGGGGCGGGGC